MFAPRYYLQKQYFSVRFETGDLGSDPSRAKTPFIWKRNENIRYYRFNSYFVATQGQSVIINFLGLNVVTQ